MGSSFTIRCFEINLALPFWAIKVSSLSLAQRGVRVIKNAKLQKKVGDLMNLIN